MGSTALRERGLRAARRLAPGALVALALAGCSTTAPPPLTVPRFADAVPAPHGPPPTAPIARAGDRGCVEAVRREVPIYAPSGVYRVPLELGEAAPAPDDCPEPAIAATAAGPGPEPGAGPPPAPEVTGAPAYFVQLAALANEAAAERAWAQLRREHGEVLADLERRIEPAETERGRFHRLRVGPFADRAAAAATCQALQERRAACFVVRPRAS